MINFKTPALFFAILFSCLLLIGCNNGNDDDDDNSNTKTDQNLIRPQGNILILQAYGNSGDGSPAGVSHSFVELYNISDKAINLNGISLYFADGIRSAAGGPEVTEDSPWKSIALKGTIPAEGSFLILGKKHDDLTKTRYKIEDNYGDINDDSLSLSRRGFKIAIISGSAELTAQNPFTSKNGKPVSGYIDMVGALNDSTNALPDHIFGFETAPARCSASEAVRRQNLIDSDDNSQDFIAARYASSGDGAFTDELIELRKPRNSSVKKWDPFVPEAAPPDISSVVYSGLKLNEVSGVGDDSEKFYELINTGTADIPLYNCKIYYNANSSPGGTLPSGKGNLTWTGLASQKIEAGKLLSLVGRNNVGSFTTGLTAQRILIITLEDPNGNIIDQCIRTRDTGVFAFNDKSFSRIPDGTGDFYFTAPTPNATNGASTAGLTKFPKDPPIISDFGRNISSVTPADKVIVSAKVTTTTSTITTVVLKWTIAGIPQNNINMTKNGSVYTAEIQALADGSAVTYKVSAVNNFDETVDTGVQDYIVVSIVVDYSRLKLNEVSGVGEDSEKFYELKNTGTKDIPLSGCKIYYNANSATGGTLPAGEGNVTWTGLSTQTIQAGQLFSLVGRNNAGSFTTGLTGARILIITLKDPAGNILDQCIRTSDTGNYAFTDKSFSRIPDGTGDFYFTEPTPNATNGTSTAGLTKLPKDPPYISAFGREPSSVTTADAVTVSATITTTTSTITMVVLQWTIAGIPQNNINMTKNGNVYTAEIPAQAVGSVVTYKVSAANNLGETFVTDAQNYTVTSAPVDYTKLKLNEVSGVGADSEKFYELKNIGDKDILLDGCKIYYNANSATGGTLPTGDGNVTWTGLSTQTIQAGQLFSLVGRNNVGSFTTGLTGARILIITLKDPAGNILDQCIRTSDTGNYAFNDKSFSRIPDGTGDFYFTEPTPNATNGASTIGLTKLPKDPPYISTFGREPSSVTAADAVTVSATITTTTSTITTVVLQWTLGGLAQSNISMTASGNVYSAEISAQAVDSAVTYKVSATNNLGETYVTDAQNYTVTSAPVDYTKLVLNEVSGNNKFVEIYNSGTVDIPMQGVKLQRNDGPSSGGSEWVGAAIDSIPAGEYRLILFNSATAGLDTNPAYVGWKVSSGISSSQVLKVAIVDPAGNPVDVFIRGDVPLPAWQSTATQDSTHSYSRMDTATWAYADPTPGAANGSKVADILSPGYLTAQPQP